MREVLQSVVRGIRKSPALNSMARACVKAIPDKRHVTKMRDIGPVAIRLRRHRYLLWEHPLVHDAFMVSLFARLIRPGDVVYDIGANIGLYTRLMHRWFGASYIYAFEPMLENRELLEENIRLGNIQKITEISPLALSDTAGKEELQIDDMNSGSAVLNSISGAVLEFSVPHTLEQLEILECPAYGFVKENGGPIYRRLSVSDFDHLGNNNILAAYDEDLLRPEPRPLARAPISG